MKKRWSKRHQKSGGAIPNSVIFGTHRAPNRDIRDPNTLKEMQSYT
jgi:hypothetical protein